ncbi:hypothetical protein CONLIGDRAFT_630199 [Coniochaeta ligniaria NRRL 30616]|uniref:Uncharacterized protein n=1 Tax=Coniochaeta ligniaria NRRL 30616 TaxID=1408157 RepID=A0A1J7IYD8_9PEZI|nr:hypothetical protein CONLIGDRAFT_630199 [Coniochaeta ligniaria NRRL 30616]
MPSTATPSSSAAAPAPALGSDRLRSHLETNPVKFHVKAGNAKWACTLMHRNSYERQRAARTDSSTSTATNSSASSIGSK